MPRNVDDVLAQLRRRLAERVGAEERARRAEQLAQRIPLVHRTGRRGPWQDIFRAERLEASAPGTSWEREVLGIIEATYFFWGYGAYPHGSVALLLARPPTSVRSTAAPFDTGGCEAGFFESPGGPLSPDERANVLEAHVVDDGHRVVEYGGCYVAQLFDEPLDYLRRPQHSMPDHAPLHALRSPSGDRRAWTIELQVHGGVPVPPQRLVAVVVRRRAQLRLLPPQYRRITAVSSRADDFGQGIADWIVTHVIAHEEAP